MREFKLLSAIAVLLVFLNLSSTAQTLLNEPFTNSLPAGWTTVGNNTNGVVIGAVNSANAGGTPWEADFNANAATITPGATYRLYYGPINTTGYSNLTLTFNTYLNHFGGGYVYNAIVQTSTDQATWHNTSWNNSPVTATIPAGIQTASITTTDVGSPTLYLCFTVTGNAFGLYDWFIDNVKLIVTPVCTTPSVANTLTLTPNAGGPVTGTFNAPGTAPTGYLVIRTATATPPSIPVDGTTYTAGTNALGGYIVSTNTTTGFYDNTTAPSTPYWYWIYSYNSICVGQPFYSATSLNGNTTTLACTGATNTMTIPTAGLVANWSTGANWSLGHAPYPCEDAVITWTKLTNGGFTSVITIDVPVTVKSLTITGTYGGTGTKLLEVFSTTATNPIVITNDLTLSGNGGAAASRVYFATDGTVRVGGNTSVGASGNRICGTGAYSATPTYTFIGNVLYGNATSASLNFSQGTYIFDGGAAQTLTNNGTGIPAFNTFKVGNANTPTLTLAGTGATLMTVAGGDLSINSGSTLVLPTGFTLNQNTAGGTLSVAATGTLKLAGTTGGQAGSNFPSGFGTISLNAASTVEYNGVAAQTIYAVPPYGNLTLSNNSTKTAGAGLTIAGNLLNNATSTFAGSTFTHNLTGGNWTNNGTFTFGTSTVNFTNASGNQLLNGTTANTTFYNLTLNKASGKNVTLSGANGITVNHALNVTLGSLVTNANTVTLAAAATITEAAGQTVIGNLTKTKVFGSPDNFGGMGVTITSATALGSTTVTRVTGTASTGNGFQSVKRYFNISPTTNTGLNAQLDFTYNDAANDGGAFELNGNLPASLTLFKSTDAGVTWTNMFASGVAGSTVTQTGLNDFSRWTVSSNPLSPATITGYPSPVCQGQAGVVITGTNLAGATSVTIGGTAATITGNTNTSVTVTVGAGTTGPVVIVCTAGTVTSTSFSLPDMVVNNNTISLSSAAGTDAQTVCINTPITTITYNTTGATGATVTGLPPGVSGVWAANVVTISGTPTTTVGSPFTYTVTLTGGCNGGTATGTITVSPANTISLTSAAGTDNQTLCINTPITNITYGTTGATGATVTGLPTGVTGTWSGNVVTITGTPTASGVFNYTVTLTGGCGTVTTTGTITVTANNTITLTSSAGTDNQSVCVNTPINNITYGTTGATGGTVTGLPAGVTGVWAANVVTISGTPTVSGVFNYTVTLTGGCGVVTATGTITVTAANTIILTSAVGTDNQTLCINTPLTNITYSTTGATGATVTGLPGGVSGTWASNVVTISGTPTASSTFNYTVTLTGGCGNVTATGTIIVNPDPVIALTPLTQTICSGDPVNLDINATLQSNTSNFEPGGISLAFNKGIYMDISNNSTVPITVNTIRLYMVPPASGVSNNGQYDIYMTTSATTAVGNYNVPGAWTLLVNPTFSFPAGAGNLVYFYDMPLGASSFILTPGQSKGLYIVGVTTTPGQFNVAYRSAAFTVATATSNAITLTTRNSSSATFTASGANRTYYGIMSYAAGYNYSWTRDNTVNITGVSSGTTFPITDVLTNTTTTPQTTIYTVTATSAAGCTSTATASVLVNPTNTITLTSATGTDNQTVCINTPITDITYSTTGATGATVTGLPAGVTGSWSGSVVTITGTPTASGVFNYTVTLTGGCGTVTATGTITVTADNTITLTSATGTDNQTVCINTPITDITYSTTGATGATVTGLPAGVTGSWSGSVVTITGTPTASGVFNYTVTLTGGCGTVTATGTITVTADNTITLTSATGTDNQTVCINTPITDITYSTTGATGATVTGLPAGVTGSWSGSVVTITGTPTASGVFNYTVTLTGGCGTVTATGTITVTADNTITLTSATGTDNQTVCINTPITDITYSTTGATGATVTGLPAGVTGSWSGSVVTITGTPTASGVFNYTVTLTGGCGTVTATGTITVTADNTITLTSATGTDNQTVCINTPITDITYSTTGATGATVTGLPAGVTGSWSGSVVTITGTPTASGVFNYAVTLTGGCGTVTATGTITVTADNTITLTSATGTDNQTVCINTPITDITYSTTGSTGATVTGLPAGVTGSWSGSVVTITGTPTASGVFNYTVTLTGGCGTVTATGTITVTADNTITLTSATGTDNQTVCINTPITDITYSTTGATGATVTGLPAGVTGSWSGSVVTITGTPTASGVFNYTVTLTGGCGTVTATGTITVTADNTITLTSATGTDNQTVCINTPITDITYSTTGATGATVTGLPAGVTGSWSGSVVTITGTPTASGVFNYTVTLTGGCGTVTATGTITVTADNTITLTSATGTDNQTVCINTPITDITYSTTGATGATVTGLPAGVTGSWSGSVVTITGTPTASGVFNYTVTLTGGCGTVTATGTITVTADNTITLTSATGTDNQTVCINTPITDITYSTTGATGATVTGLPAGVTGSWSGSVVTITGTPTASGVFNYTVTLTGGCGTVTATGTITVTADNTITLTSATGTDNQTVCINTPITDITYSTTGATGATVTGLPAGVTGSWSGSVVTITGTPTASGVFNYTVTLTGGCGTVTATGTITVTADNTITLTSATGTDNQTVCINTPITDITYSTTGATGATVTGLPAGVTGSWSGSVVTITGTPTASGVFNYTVTLTGGCGTVTATGTITVTADNTITLTSATGTDNQTVCINTPITDITYSTTGATGATVTGLPAGVTGSWSGSVVTITGTPTASGVFNYTVTLTGGCGTVTATGTITVTADNTITLTSATGTDNQTVCINTPITDITYSTTGATGATVTGLPAGVTGSWSGSVVTITGTPTASGVFNYTVTLTGGCGTVTATGTITVTADNTITLTSAAGTDNQTVCINTPITDITYSTTGATGATVTGLPAGVTGSWSGSVVTITGTPTASGVFNYTVTLTGGCGTVTATGTIRVTTSNTATLTSAAGTDNQTVCINTPITDITYSTTGATGATFSGLPAGVTGSWSSNVATITGTPTVSGVFNYTVTLTGGCGVVNVNGTITVSASAPVNLTSAAGTDNQTIPLGTSIVNITYSISGSGTGATVTGLPAGVTGNYSGGVFTISGTPTVVGVFPYTVTAVGGCGSMSGTITVTTPLPVTFVSLNGYQRGPGSIQLEWRVANETGIDHYDVERSVTGISFAKISNSVPSAGSSLYTLLDQNPNRGVNFYRVKAVDVSGQKTYTNIVKVVLGITAGSITIAPNPIIGNQVSLQFNNEPQGFYNFRLFNSVGQLVLEKVLNHSGGSSTQTIELPYKFSQGIYNADIILPDNTRVAQRIVIAN